MVLSNPSTSTSSFAQTSMPKLIFAPRHAYALDGFFRFSSRSSLAFTLLSMLMQSRCRRLRCVALDGSRRRSLLVLELVQHGNPSEELVGFVLISLVL